MPDHADLIRPRAFVDGPATKELIDEREKSVVALAPKSAIWAADDSRVALARAAFESGWDAAISQLEWLRWEQEHE